MKKLSLLTALLLAIGVTAGSATAQEVLAPSSTLVYPLFDVGTGANAKRSTLKITNLGDPVSVHMVRVCGAPLSFGGAGLCQTSNRYIQLTREETAVRDVASFFGLSGATCPTGYIIASGNPASELIGSMRITGSGALNQRAAAMQAYGIDALGDPELLLTDFEATNGAQTRYSELTLLNLSSIPGAQNPLTTVALDWTNQNEEPFSGSFSFVCHARVRLDALQNPAQPGASISGAGNFRSFALGSQYGLLKVRPSSPNDFILGAIAVVGQNRLTLRKLWLD